MRRPVIAGAVVLLLGWWPPTTRHCEVSFEGQVSTSSWTPWDGWVLVGSWALAAFVLLSGGRLLRRVVLAGVLWIGGLVALFLGVP